ncbi:hypothetical protein BZA77DRAFT_317775 [Pyronema omphalodes]|nr:hypothetical protein BZA77DRAFT_317775 [Pyronema omphalodes]
MLYIFCIPSFPGGWKCKYFLICLFFLFVFSFIRSVGLCSGAGCLFHLHETWFEMRTANCELRLSDFKFRVLHWIFDRRR